MNLWRKYTSPNLCKETDFIFCCRTNSVWRWALSTAPSLLKFVARQWGGSGSGSSNMLRIAAMHGIGQEKEWEDGVRTHLLSPSVLHQYFLTWLRRRPDARGQEEIWEDAVWGSSSGSPGRRGRRPRLHDRHCWPSRAGKIPPQVRPDSGLCASSSLYAFAGSDSLSNAPSNFIVLCHSIAANS